MSKKIILIVSVLFVLLSINHLIAREEDAPPPQPQRRADARQGSGSPQGRQGPRFMQQFDGWIDQLAEAHKQKDSEKIGQIIGEMKDGTQRWQQMRQNYANRSRQGQRRPRQTGQRRPRTTSETPSVLSSADEKKIMEVLDDMFANERRGMMNVPLKDGRILRLLTETTGAKHVVEIGTSNGYSGIWFALALKKTGGRLVTHEINAERAALARKNFKRAGVENIITLVEGNAHEKIADIKRPIDILFLDADKEGYSDYLKKLLPLVRPGGLVLAHNTTNAGPQMQDYLKTITTNPDLETIFLNKEERGLGVTLKKR